MQSILFVEDAPGCQLPISVALRAAGFVVTVARDGRAALDHLWRSRPDLVLLDLGMPEANGTEVLSQMRGEPRWMTIPVIVFTASTDAAARAKAEDLGISAFLIKSQVSLLELLAAARRCATGATVASSDEGKLSVKRFGRASCDLAMEGGR